jgi:hypothetical protein
MGKGRNSINIENDLLPLLTRQMEGIGMFSLQEMGEK